MSIKALSIHPEVGGPNITVEAGQPIKGMVKLTLSKPVPDIRVTVTFYGEKQATWLEDGDPARPYTVSPKPLITEATTIFDSTVKGKGGVLPAGAHMLPFTIQTESIGFRKVNLNTFPPTYTYDGSAGSDVEKAYGGSANIRYSLRCAASYTSGFITSKRVTTTATTDLFVSQAGRAKRLLYPFPFVTGNVVAPGSPRKEMWPIALRSVDSGEVRWNLSMSRRACLPGDNIECVVIAQSIVKKAIARVTLSLRETTVYATMLQVVHLSNPETRELAVAREHNWSTGLSPDMSSPPIVRTMNLHVPRDCAATLRTQLMSNTHVVRLIIEMEDESEPCTVVEVPLDVVMPDAGKGGREFVPELPREDSLNFTKGQPLSRNPSLKSLKSLKERADSALGDIEEPLSEDGEDKENGSEEDEEEGGKKERGLKIPLLGETPTVIKGRFRALYAYLPNRPDEISVEQGDIVHIRKSFKDGWAICENETRSSTGIVPIHHLQFAPENHSPPVVGFPKREDFSAQSAQQDNYSTKQGTGGSCVGVSKDINSGWIV
ncbi:hypothetical protein HK097_011464 [Rhizophlyctis rosea]|uniref:SH3 domain-containing protein n=1 Tax=Rhizophlyctis rosea TaxID=64517 RepID=A0AAD5X1V7_9FUNG|nr:hypothetical protein HK097_011464 [Rhizophlyctis rosea]